MVATRHRYGATALQRRDSPALSEPSNERVDALGPAVRRRRGTAAYTICDPHPSVMVLARRRRRRCGAHRVWQCRATGCVGAHRRGARASGDGAAASDVCLPRPQACRRTVWVCGRRTSRHNRSLVYSLWRRRHSRAPGAHSRTRRLPHVVAVGAPETMA